MRQDINLSSKSIHTPCEHPRQLKGAFSLRFINIWTLLMKVTNVWLAMISALSSLRHRFTLHNNQFSFS